MSDEIQLQHDEWFYASDEVKDAAIIKDYDAIAAEAKENPEAFWAKRANTLEWYSPWKQVLDRSQAPFYKWFVGAKTNIVLNALDRHIKSGKSDKVAYYWEGEPGDSREITYGWLNEQVCRFANVLRGLGIQKGDTVTIYMGRVPEIIVAMLACAKLGATHSVVYGGFSEHSLSDRINDAKSRLLVTCDGAWLRGKIVPLKQIADDAVIRSPTIQRVIVVKRTGQEVNMEAGRDEWWHDVMSVASAEAETVQMDAEDPLFILYTSGTTGKPKGIVHTHGGYQVYTSTTLSWVFDIKDEDVYWCAADPGWITGHSYIVYAPLILSTLR